MGGPEAGNVRVIPESVGAKVTSGDYVYRVIGLSFQGDRRVIWFAYDWNKAPSQLMLELWDEYSPTATIKRKTQSGS